MEWLDLVAPSAAILALFGVVGLVVHAIRQSRAIRRLEERLAQAGGAAEEAPLQRIAELQARHRVSSGTPPAERSLRTAGAIAAVAVVLVAAIGGVWFLFLRDDGGADATAQEPAAATTRAGTAANPPQPVDRTLVPDDVPPLADKTQYSVAVFNASGVTGAAAERANYLRNVEGYQVPVIDDAPDGTTDLRESVVMWTRGNRRVAQNVAQDLGIDRAPPVDGLTDEQLGGAEVAVLIGLDIANGGTAAAP